MSRPTNARGFTDFMRDKILAAATELAESGAPENLTALIRATGVNHTTVRKVRVAMVAAGLWPEFAGGPYRGAKTREADPTPEEIAERSAAVLAERVQAMRQSKSKGRNGEPRPEKRGAKCWA